MGLVKTLIEEVSGWPQVTVHPHQFMAREFRYGTPQIGHIHLWGDVDIPFIRPLRVFLVQNRLAANHRWLPDSGWTTFHIGNKSDFKHALWLMRISYLRIDLRLHPDPVLHLKEEAERLCLSPELATLLRQSMRKQKAD